MKKGLIAQLIALTLISATSNGAFADEPDVIDRGGPSEVDVVSVRAAGSGCPTGAADAVIYADSLLKIDLSRISTRAGSGIPFSEMRKFCQLIIELAHPAGWTYAVDAAEATTESYLTYGTYGKVAVSTYFQGEFTTARAEQEIRGPHFGVGHHLLEFSGTNYAPCAAQRALNVKAEVQSRSNGRSYARVKLVGAVFVILKWKRCGADILR